MPYVDISISYDVFVNGDLYNNSVLFNFGFCAHLSDNLILKSPLKNEDSHFLGFTNIRECYSRRMKGSKQTITGYKQEYHSLGLLEHGDSHKVIFFPP